MQTLADPVGRLPEAQLAQDNAMAHLQLVLWRLPARQQAARKRAIATVAEPRGLSTWLSAAGAA